MKNYLFMPIESLGSTFGSAPRMNDPFIIASFNAFLAHNPDNRLIRSNKKITWAQEQIVPRELVFTDPFKFGIRVAQRGGPAKKNIFTGSLTWSSWRSNQLANLEPLDCLFVVGHGNFSGEYLARKHLYKEDAKQCCDMYMIHATVLAKAIELSQLNKRHKYIKLNSCFGGGNDGVIPFSEMSMNGSSILARKLATELGNRGYDDILVGGYNYPTFHRQNDLCLMAMMTPDSSDYGMFTVNENTCVKDAYKPVAITFDEDPYRIWYDASGSMVRWNEPEIPPDHSKTAMLDAAANPKWASYQQVVADWERDLAERNLG
jgi:hypothetical protein